jgi:hypothetical protein
MSSSTPRYASIPEARAAGEDRPNISDMIFINELVSEGAVCSLCRVTGAEKKLSVCANCKLVLYVNTVISTKL